MRQLILTLTIHWRFAILHDVIEDTPVTRAELEKEFGPVILNLVMQVSDDKTLPKVERKKLQVEHARGKLSAGARFIKFADKIDNCSGLLTDPPKGWTEDDIEGYLAWSSEVVSALLSSSQEYDEVARKLYQVFSSIICQWKRNPHLLVDPDKRRQILERYYATMTIAK